MVTKIIKSNITKIVIGGFITIILALGTWGLSNIVKGIEQASAMQERTRNVENDISNVINSLPNYVKKYEFDSQLSKIEKSICDNKTEVTSRLNQFEDKLDHKFDAINKLIIDEMRKAHKK